MIPASHAHRMSYSEARERMASWLNCLDTDGMAMAVSIHSPPGETEAPIIVFDDEGCDCDSDGYLNGKRFTTVLVPCEE